MNPNDTQVHHFSSGVYAKELRIPAGMIGRMHKHQHDHLSVLALGRAWVTIDGARTMYQPGSVITIKAGSYHEVRAIDDIVWLCIHATEETDPAKVDSVLVEGGSDAVL